MSILKRLSLIGGSTVMAQTITACGIPILSRLYTPEAFTGWAIFLSISLLFSGLATLRYELAIVLPKEPSTAAALGIGGILLAVLTSCCAGIAAWFLSGWFVNNDPNTHFQLWWWIIPLAVLGTAAYQLSLAWCTHQAAFKAYSLAQLVLPAAVLLAQVGASLLGHSDSLGLILGMVAGQLFTASALVSWIFIHNQVLFRENANRSRIQTALLSYPQYPLYMTPYTLIATGRDRLAYFLLGRLGSVDSAGFYATAARLVNLPNSLVTSTLRPVFFRHAALSDTRTLETTILTTIRSLGIGAVVCWAPCVVQSTWLVEIVLGRGWSPSAQYIVALSIPTIPLLMGNWLDRLFDVLGRQRMALALEAAFSILAMGGLGLGYLIFHDLFIAICVQCALLTLYYICWIAVLFHAAKFRIAPLVAVFAWVFIAGLVCLTASLGLARVLSPALAFATTIACSVGFATWYGWRSWRKAMRNATEAGNSR